MNADDSDTRDSSGEARYKTHADRMHSKIFLLLFGNMATAIITLIRNLIVARMISVEHYGIVASFAVAISLTEMMSSFGLQQQIVQSKTDDPEWQAALQGFQLLRALVAAAAMFFLSGHIAAFFGVPEIAWAYKVLALVPLMFGCLHLDIHRLNRQMVYMPLMLTHTVPAFITLLMIWPLWLIFGDWRVMLFATVTQAGLGTILSFFVAERRWRIRFDRTTISGILSFGWPLLVNNLLLFAVLNGEKLIVGREIGLAALAILAMGFTLTLTPTLVMAKSIQSFFLPQLSAVQDDDNRFQPLARATIEANFFNGALLILGVVLVGEPFLAIVLGEKYASLSPLLVWLALLQAMRVFKAGGAVVGLAKAKTENAMVSNIFRVFSLPLSWWAAITAGDILVVIWIATAGEVLGVVTSIALARLRTGVRLAPLFPLFSAITAFLAVVVLHASLPLLITEASSPRWPTMLACGILFGVCVWTMTATTKYLRNNTLIKHSN